MIIMLSINEIPVMGCTPAPVAPAFVPGDAISVSEVQKRDVIEFGHSVYVVNDIWQETQRGIYRLDLTRASDDVRGSFTTPFVPKFVTLLNR